MKKNIKIGAILISLICIITVIVINIQKPCTHIDKNNDMRCDRCKGILPYNEYVFYNELEAQIGENKITVMGNMLPNSAVQVVPLNGNNINLDEARKKYSSIKGIISCFDISIKNEEKEYNPSDYLQKCTINIENLALDNEKKYAVLHDIGNSNYELLNANIEDGKLSFVTSHFSVFMVVEVGGYNISFEGENYKVLDKNFNEITSTYTVPGNVNFEFYVMPDEGYGIADVGTSTQLNSGDNEYLYAYGYAEGYKGLITAINKDINVNVNTALLPKISGDYQIRKVKIGTQNTWTVDAENATTYLWQYRVGKNDYWKNANTLGSGYNTATFKTNSVSYDYGNIDFRCLVGNDTFTSNESAQSYNFKVIAADDEIVYADYPVILSETVNQYAKKENGKEKAVFEVTAMSGVPAFKWQYRNRENDYWKDVGSSVGTVSVQGVSSEGGKVVSKTILTTVNVSPEISNYEFRCLVGNKYHSKIDDMVKSSTMYPIPTQNEISQNIQYHKLVFTKQPESAKVKLGSKAVFEVETEGVNTYVWQYKASPLDEAWSNVDSSIGSGYNTKTLTVDTSKMSVNENLELENNISGYLFRCLVSNTSLKEKTESSDIAILVVSQDVSESKPIAIDSVSSGMIAIKVNSDGLVNGVDLLKLNKTSDNTRTINLKYVGKLLMPHTEITLQKRTGTNAQGVPVYTDISKISDYINISLNKNEGDLTLKDSELSTGIYVYDVSNMESEYDLEVNLKSSIESGVYKLTFDLLNASNKKIATEAIIIQVD